MKSDSNLEETPILLQSTANETFSIYKKEIKKENKGTQTEKIEENKMQQNIKIIKKNNLKNDNNNIYNKDSKIFININNNKSIENKYYKPKGLENFNFNCYMNSLLQCFFYLKDFRKYFLETNFEKDQLMCQAMKDAMEGLNANDGKKFFSAKKIKNEIRKNEIFRDGEGSDVTDLLSFIFETIIYEFDDGNSSLHTVKYQTKTYDKKLMYSEIYNEVNFDLIINKLFIGFYEKEFFCKNNHFKYSFQNEYRIVFSLEEIFNYYKDKNYLTLYECFDHYQRVQKKYIITNEKEEEEERNDESNLFNNNHIIFDKEENEEGSKGDSDLSKKESNSGDEMDDFDNCQKCEQKYMLIEKLYRTPKYLIIILDRGYKKKCDKTVKYDIELDLLNYMDDNKYEYNTKYILTGVCVHHGKTGYSGHYTSICLCDDNLYYRLNDSHSRPLEKKEELYEGSPYMLFYSRLDLTNNQKIIRFYSRRLKNKINQTIENMEFEKKYSIKKDIKDNLLNYSITENKGEIFNTTTIQIDFSDFNHKTENPKITIKRKFAEKKREKNETEKIEWDNDLTAQRNIKRFEEFIDSYFQEFKTEEKVNCGIF